MRKLLREEPEVLALVVIVLLLAFGRFSQRPVWEPLPPAIQMIRL